MTRLQPSSFLLLGTFWFPETRLQPSSFILFFVAFWFPGTWLQPSAFFFSPSLAHSDSLRHDYSLLLFFFFGAFWFPETRLQPSSFLLLWDILIPWDTITAFFFSPYLWHSDSLRHDYSLLLFSFFGTFWFPETRLQPSSFLLWRILIPWDTITAFFFSPSLGNSDSLRHDYSSSSFLFLWGILILRGCMFFFLCSNNMRDNTAMELLNSNGVGRESSF